MLAEVIITWIIFLFFFRVVVFYFPLFCTTKTYSETRLCFKLQSRCFISHYLNDGPVHAFWNVLSILLCAAVWFSSNIKFPSVEYRKCAAETCNNTVTLKSDVFSRSSLSSLHSFHSLSSALSLSLCFPSCSMFA